MTNTSASLQLTLLWMMLKLSQVLLHLVGLASGMPASEEGPDPIASRYSDVLLPRGVDFQQFCDRLRTDLRGDSHGRGSFDTSARFVAGDPGARFGAAAPLEYEVTGEIGHPHWDLIFEYVLRQCGYLVEFHTVYVMVDNRELANHKRQDPSLPHWPAAARWWHSRLKLIGPHKEKTELLLFSISATTGLHHVHPTWAGTFVLAALVAMFPGINFVLLDSDCLPVTLFEVEDLWTEAFLARFPAHTESAIRMCKMCLDSKWQD